MEHLAYLDGPNLLSLSEEVEGIVRSDINYESEYLLLQELDEEETVGPSFNDTKFLSSNGQPKELFLSSDASAVVEHTKKVLVIEDGEVVHLKVLFFTI